MKVFTLYILVLTLPLLSWSYPAQSEEKSIALDEAEVDSEHAETGKDITTIQKRSGSFDYVTQLKSGLLSSIGHASASIASGSSGGSSGGSGNTGGGYKSYEGNVVEYDPWSFKKSVLNTIFQAVKAITGGVTALKGQLIKGSGYALSASGNLVATSGDKVTDVGKAIINSAHANTATYGPGHGSGGGGAVVHPFAKFSSLSGASSSSGQKPAGPVVHTETITTYEIPAGHSSYGPPTKPPTYSSATHQYLPPPGAGYSGGGAPFSGGGGGHQAFEAPQTNYLPTAYGHDGHDDFNIYGRHKQLSTDEARKAAAQLQEILHLLPDGKTEYTASKTVTLDAAAHAFNAQSQINPEQVELQTYGLPNEYGPLESLSHTESITAAYRPPARPHAQLHENPSDIYRQMAKKQSPEATYIQNHPEEGYDYRPTRRPDVDVALDGYKYNNYHATTNTKSALRDLTPIIAALEVAKRSGGQGSSVNTKFTIEKNVHKVPPPSTAQTLNYLSPAVHKTKYTYFTPPAQTKAGPASNYRPTYTESYKVRRRRTPPFTMGGYEIEDPLLFNRLLMP